MGCAHAIIYPHPVCGMASPSRGWDCGNGTSAVESKNLILAVECMVREPVIFESDSSQVVIITIARRTVRRAESL